MASMPIGTLFCGKSIFKLLPASALLAEFFF
jgi:hypothetical protein